MDQVVGSFASRGIRVLAEVDNSPGYAAPSPIDPPLGSATARQDWQAFLRAAVARYGRGGVYWTDPSLYRAQHPGAKPLPVRDWQIWNEPNLPNHFTKVSPVSKYATLLRISHQAVKAEDRRANVVLAGLAGFKFGHLAPFRAWDFLDRLYRAGVKRSFDVAAIHPYAANLRQLRLVMNRMRKTMKRHGDRNTKLWLTEIGWGSGKPKRSAPLLKGLQGQKRLLQRAFKLIIHNRRSWAVRGISYYDWVDTPPPNNNCTFCASIGLIRYTDQPKPAWGAYKRIIRTSP
jgi:hypothetical protein